MSSRFSCVASRIGGVFLQAVENRECALEVGFKSL